MSIPSFITTNKLKNILPNTTDKIKNEKLTNDKGTRTKLKTKTNLTFMKLSVTNVIENILLNQNKPQNSFQ